MTGLQLYIMYTEELPSRHELNHRSWDDLEQHERDAWDRLAAKVDARDLP